MARQTNIKLRRSATANAIPTTSNLDLGELALNTNDGKLYMKTTEGSLDSVIQVGSATDSYFKIRKSVTQTLTVKVVAKTTDHKYHGQGSSLGYNINGIESPHFNLVPGNTYRFDQSDSSNSGHPLRFYYEADKTTAYTTGVTTNGTPGSSGAYTQIVPTGDTPMCLYYQCSAHGYMGNKASFNTRNFTGFDTADLAEGTNLYFTNARVDARLAATDHTIDGNGSTGGINIADGHITIRSGTGNPGQIDLYCEVNNAHRVRLKAPAHSAFSGNPDIVLPNSSGTLALMSDLSVSSSGSGSLAYNNSTGVFTYTGPTNAQVQSAFSAGTGVTISSGSIAIGQDVGTTVSPTFNNLNLGYQSYLRFNSNASNSTPAILFGNASGTGGNISFKRNSDNAVAMSIDADGDVIVTGNLTVQGTTTTLNTATLDVEDKNITLNFGSGDTSSTANGAGITIQDAVNSSTDATILWNATSDEFDFSHGITLPDNQKITLGTGGDVEIFHDGNNSIIKDTGDGHVQVLSGTFTIGNAALSKTSAVFNSGSSQDFYHDNTKKLETTANGITVSGGVTASGTNVLSGLTYPTSDGANGQALITDGSGNLSFSSISAGGNAFGTIAVSGQSNVVADSNSDTLTLVAGSNITITTTPGTDTVTINSTASGSAITVQDEGSSLSTAAGTLNFVGSGVTATGSGTTKTITIPGGSNGVTVQEEGSSLSTAGTTLNFVGSGVTATGTGATKTITIPGGGSSDVFKTIAVSGQSSVVADSTADTLTLAAGSGMTITTDASTDTITFASSGGSGSTAAADIKKTFVYTTSSSTTAFTGADDNSQTLSYVVGAVDVFLNGVKQQLTTDYAETNSSTITFVNAVASGNVVEIIAYYTSIGTNNSVVDQFTASGSAAFTLSSNPGNENNVLVYIDGVYQQKTDYSVSGTTLTFDTAPASGAIVECVTMRGVITDQQDLTLTGELDVVTLDVSGNGDIDGNLLVGGNLHLDGNNQELRFYEGSNFVGFEAPALSGDQIWVLPDSDGTAGFALKTDGSGNLSWGLAGDNAFKTIAVSGQSDVVADSTADTLTLAAGTGIAITTNASSDTITITNNQLGANAFGNIAVSGQTTVAADSTNDTLTLEAGAGITLTNDATNDKITIAGGSGSVFTTDFFTASGSGSALLTYTLTETPSSENELICFIEGVYQNKNSYTLTGNSLVFDSGIVAGQEVVVHHIGAGIVGTSPTIHTETGDGTAYSYTLPFTPPNENYLQVFWDGVYQNHDQYTVSGTTLDFGSSNVPPSGTAIEVVIPSVNGIGTPSDGTVTPAKLSTGGPSWDGNSNFIIGSHYQRSDSTSISSTSATTIATHAAATYRSVKYNVQITQGSAYHSTEINVIHDGSNVAMGEYGTIFTGSSLATFDATISSGNLLLQVTMGSASSATIKVMSTAVTV